MVENEVPPLSSQAEWVRSGIAVFVVVFAFAIIGYAWGLRGISDAKELSAIFLGMVGIVMGYYFGSKGVSKAQVSDRVKGLAVMLYLLGLSYGAVSLAMESLGVPFSISGSDRGEHRVLR